MGLANYTGSENDSMLAYPIVHAHSSKQGGTSKALGPFTKNMKPKVKFLEIITK